VPKRTQGLHHRLGWDAVTGRGGGRRDAIETNRFAGVGVGIAVVPMPEPLLEFALTMLYALTRRR
jgi:hypothetical protein